MRSDISLLIQGPLNDSSLDLIDKYREYASEIVVSTWRNQDLNRLCSIKDIIVCAKDQIDAKPFWENGCIYENSTFYWQVESIALGLRNCTRKFTIRTRADEGYENLLPLIEEFEKDTSKIVFGNVFIWPHREVKYHIGDHLFIGSTEVLSKTYNRISQFWHGNEDAELEIIGKERRRFGISPEQVIGENLLLNMGHSLTEILSYDPELIRKNFGVVCVSKLAPFIARFNTFGQTYVNELSGTLLRVCRTLEEWIK